MNRLYGPSPGEPEPLRPVADLAGLFVDDAEGRPTGEVYGSLADARSGLVRYIDVALADSDRHVLVPIGHARVERRDGHGHVRLRAAVRDELDEIPPASPEPVTPDRDLERAVLAAHGRFFYGERYYAHPAYDHSGLYAGEHPIVGGEAEPGEEPSGLAPLSSLPAFRVSPHEPDVRGWPFHTASGERAGTVRDLIVDPTARRVRYIVVERAGGRNDVMLPVGFVRIEADARRVDAPVLTRDDLDALPPAPGRSITRRDEERLRRRLRDRLEGERLFDRPDFGTR